MSEQKSVIIIGSGPGIGLSVAKKFAQNSYNVALLSRDSTRLETDKTAVLEAAANKIEVHTFPVDVTDNAKLEQVLSSISKEQAFSAIECVYFNCARVAPSQFFDFSVEDLEADFKTTTSALYTTAAWAMPKLLARAEFSSGASPSLLVTNSMLYKEPIPFLFSLCLTKSAQRNLVQSLAMTYQPQGVHVGLVSVEGEVRPDKPHMSPDFIAGKAWELFSQKKPDWTLEVEVLEKR